MLRQLVTYPGIPLITLGLLYVAFAVHPPDRARVGAVVLTTSFAAAEMIAVAFGVFRGTIPSRLLGSRLLGACGALLMAYGALSDVTLCSLAGGLLLSLGLIATATTKA